MKALAAALLAGVVSGACMSWGLTVHYEQVHQAERMCPPPADPPECPCVLRQTAPKGRALAS